MTAIIHSNFSKLHTEEILDKVERLLKSHNVNILYDDDTEESIKKCDFIITIGGDGTIIHHSKNAALYNNPILGINAGRVGFLTELEKDELNLIEKIIEGNYTVEKRDMLKVQLNNDVYYCLNDAVISKGAASRMIDISVNLNDDVVSYRADGLITATPTGSTAYSLSAGGPILEPNIGAILLTPICAQKAFAKSIAINMDTLIKINVNCLDNTEAYLTVDGEIAKKLKNSDTVVISREKNYFVNLIKLQNKSFYNKISEKLMAGE